MSYWCQFYFRVLGNTIGASRAVDDYALFIRVLGRYRGVVRVKIIIRRVRGEIGSRLTTGNDIDLRLFDESHLPWNCSATILVNQGICSKSHIFSFAYPSV